jgi:hypothetical protein
VLFRLNDYAVPVSEAALMVAVAAASGAVVAGATRGALPQWLGWWGLAGAGSTLVDLAGGPALLAVVPLAWLLPASVVLVRRSDAAGAAPGRVPAESL